jgi:CTP:molybdopterin cytidylyltransferase MocA
LTGQPDVAGVLLAAGQGSRIGQPKALLEVGGQSLAWRGIELLRAGGAGPVVVVTGAAGPGALGPRGPVSLPPGRAAAPAGRPAGSDADLITVHNPAWAAGMGSSLAAGLAVVPARCGAVVIALADQPLVGPDAVRRLIAACRDGASVAVACYGGKPRNPVLISREHWAEVAALAAGDVGARPFLRAHPELVTHVECGDTGRPDDIDTPDDLARLRQLLAER